MTSEAHSEKSSESLETWPRAPFGTPLPEHPHAISVWMPCWQDVIDYEEGAERAKTLMKTGYPRFFFHTSYQALCDRYNDLIDTETQFIRVFPSERTAKDCFAFAGGGEIVSDKGGVYACAFANALETRVKHYWQHAGAMVSSRQAEAILNGTPEPDGERAKTQIKAQLAALYESVPERNITLYSNGMAAIYKAYEIVCGHAPETKTIQLGFPYLDTLKIQEKFGKSCHFVAHDDFERLEEIFKAEKIAAVFTEAPTNPLLDTVDFKRLRALLDRYDIPLVVDDTVGTVVNLDLTAYADIIVTSLTKFYCGSGVVCGGSLALNPSSPFYEVFQPILENSYEDLLYGADAIEVAENGRDFESRMQVINKNAEALADYLQAHPLVKTVYYPKFRSTALYHALRREGGGYCGLLSIVLKDPQKAPIFYNNLAIHKGPSLGTLFTLGVPFTMLAHYDELDKVEAMGVPRELIRISVGTEDVKDLIARFDQAFAARG